jgi:hypothetical protein
MMIFILSFAVVSLAVLGMAVGALAGRPPISNGCGRLRDGDCECGRDAPCERGDRPGARTS